MPCNRQIGISGTTMTGAKHFFHNVIAALRDTLTKEDFPKLTGELITPRDASFVAKTLRDEYKWNQP